MLLSQLEGQFEVTFKVPSLAGVNFAPVLRVLKRAFSNMATANITVVETKAYSGQKPGTSGLRKKVEEFMQEHYMENFLQCTLEAMGGSLPGSTLVVGGDGRYGVPHAVDKIIKMAAANKVLHGY